MNVTIATGEAFEVTPRQVQNRRFNMAKKVQVLLYEKSTKALTNNRWRGIYTEVDVVLNGTCIHTGSVCYECLVQWQQDHVVLIFEHGDSSSYSAGCRCSICTVAQGRRYTRAGEGHG